MSQTSFQQLVDRFGRLLAETSPFQGTVYRSSTPKYATSIDLLTGKGSKQNGGRWNPVGIAVLYASLTPETAMAETLAHQRYYQIPIESAMPRTFVAIEVHLRAILDLRIGTLLQRLKVSAERIQQTDWRTEVYQGQTPITQLIGQAAYEVKLEGLIVPSAVEAEGHNLIVFPDHLHAKSRITVMNADKLT